MHATVYVSLHFFESWPSLSSPRCLRSSASLPAWAGTSTFGFHHWGSCSRKRLGLDCVSSPFDSPQIVCVPTLIELATLHFPGSPVFPPPPVMDGASQGGSERSPTCACSVDQTAGSDGGHQIPPARVTLGCFSDATKCRRPPMPAVCKGCWQKPWSCHVNRWKETVLLPL